MANNRVLLDAQNEIGLSMMHLYRPRICSRLYKTHNGRWRPTTLLYP